MKSTENHDKEKVCGDTAVPGVAPPGGGSLKSGDCDNCVLLTIEECDASFHIPPCMYEEAGIDSERGIVFTVGGGEIIITEMDDEDGEDGDCDE